MSDAAGAYRALSWPFVIVLLVVWNLLQYLAYRLNPFGWIHKDPTACLVSASSYFLLSVVALAIVVIPVFRRFVTVEERRHHYEPAPFLLLAICAAAVGAITLIPVIV